MLKKCKIVFLAMFLFTPYIYSITVTSFAHTAVFTGTNASQQASMDALLGITGYAIENFEDTTLIAGVQFGPQGTTPSSTTGAGGLDGRAIWDGSSSFLTDIGQGEDLFLFDNAASVGIGIGDVETDVRMLINGVDFGLIRSLPNYNRTQDNHREVYVRIDAGQGETINSVGFSQAVPSGDGIFYDHLAFLESNVVPEPSTWFMMLFASTFFVARKRNK